MNASKTRATPRKATPRPAMTAEDKVFLATLSPKHRKIHLLARSLEGKLTDAINIPESKWESRNDTAYLLSSPENAKRLLNAKKQVEAEIASASR